MSLIKVIQPWLKQYLSDHLLDTTVELLVMQLEVYKEIDIIQANHFLNQFISQKSSNVFKQLAAELKEHIPSDADISSNDLDLKKRKKELKKLMRSVRGCEIIKLNENAQNFEGSISQELSSNVSKSLSSQSLSESTPSDGIQSCKDGTQLFTLQVKPLHKLISDQLLTNSAANTHPVPSNDLDINLESPNLNNNTSANISVPESKKHKKKKKSKEKERNLGSNNADKDPISNPTETGHIENVNNYSSGCDQNLIPSTPDSVIHCLNEQVPEVQKTDNVTEIFLKLLNFVNSLDEGHKKKITEDIFHAITSSIKESCASTAGGEESGDLGDVHERKSKKKKKDRSQNNEDNQPKEVILVDITENQDHTKPKKRKGKKRDKRRESFEDIAECMESFQKIETIGSADALENEVFESISSTNKKKKKRHRGTSYSYGSEFEEDRLPEESVKITSELYSVEEPPKKKKKKKKSRKDDLIVDEESRALAPFTAHQDSEVTRDATLNNRHRSLSGSRNEGEKSSQESTNLPTGISHLKNSSRSNSFEPTLYDLEHTMSESVINRQPINREQSSNITGHDGSETISRHRMVWSNNRQSHEESSSPDNRTTSGQPQDLESSCVSREIASNPFPSLELDSYESDKESDSSVEIVDHLVVRIKTEPLSPCSESNPVSTPEPVPVKEKRKKHSKNAAPVQIPIEIGDLSELNAKDTVQETINNPGFSGNESRSEIVSGVEFSSEVRRQENPEVTLSNVERPEVPQSNLGLAVEPIAEISSDSAQQNQYRSLEKELLELEQCLYLADKAGEPETSKSNSAVPRERNIPPKITCFLDTREMESLRISCLNSQSGRKADLNDLKCYKCGLVFNNQSNFARHWLEHIKDKFFKKSARSSHEARIYECNLCKKKFKQKVHLKTHLTHICYKNLPQEQFSCDSCSASFPTRSALYNHASVHDQSKWFTCNMCNLCFRWKNTLENHMIFRHSDLRPYKCPLCSNTFKLKRGLKRHHLSVHSDERAFKCDECDHAFKLRYNLHQHKRRCH